jgi:hypothetical protein
MIPGPMFRVRDGQQILETYDLLSVEIDPKRGFMHFICLERGNSFRPSSRVEFKVSISRGLMRE